jgi:hypothetical protein
VVSIKSYLDANRGAALMVSTCASGSSTAFWHRPLPLLIRIVQPVP